MLWDGKTGVAKMPPNPPPVRVRRLSGKDAGMSQHGSTTLLPRFLAGPADELRLSWPAALTIVLYGATLLMVNLGGNRVLTYHEAVFCEPAREMLATGDWLIPRIGGVPFLDKPPLTAWLIAGSMRLFDSRSEWVVRLPGLISANITALAIALLAARWFGNRVGLLAGLIQLTTYHTLQLARLAECDTHLIASITVAMCSFATANIDSPRGRSTAIWLPWLFYLGAGLAFLTKGPIGPFIIFSGCGLFALVNQDLRGIRFLLNPAGLGLLALCVLPYSLFAYASYPPILEEWQRNNVGRFQGELGGGRSPLYYVIHLPMVLLPWFPLIPLYLWRRRGEGVLVEPLWRFVICWMIPGMTVFLLSVFKRHHYLAPLLPGVAMLTAVALVDHLRRRHLGQRMHNGWLTLSMVAVCAGGLVIIAIVKPQGATAIAAVLVLLTVALVLMTLLESRRMFNAHLAALFASAWLAIAGVFQFVMPHHDTYGDQTQLAQRINGRMQAGESLYLLQLVESQITYYLQPPVTRLDVVDRFLNRLPVDQTCQYYIVAPERVVSRLRETGEVEVLDRCESVMRHMKPDERLTFLRYRRPPPQVAELKSRGTSEGRQ